ncbi:MAG: protein kinase, partial [Planctomycetales bacterium]|nr:protein kinase [Planctomycetales bacterium]
EFTVDSQLALAAQRDQQFCVAELISRVAHALDFAHQHGVLHRDLKPSNILIDQDGLPHLTDFGLAKLTGRETSGLTLSHAVLGTPGYLAPEQATSGLDVTTLADVYGLGATLYELLVGQPPFVGATALDTMLQAINHDPKPPRQINPAIDPDIETITLRCLEKRPEQRYASAAAVADELDRFLRREPILARPVGQLERSWKWCQRHPGVAMTAAVAILATLIGLGATWSQWYRATRANISLKENVEHLQWDLIDDMLRDGDASRALARTAALIRVDPTDWRAAMLGMSVVEQHRFPVPAIPPIRHPEGAELSMARLSPDGRTIVTASLDGTARRWNSTTGAALQPPLRHEDTVTWVAFSPNGQFVATCSADKTVRLWNVATGMPCLEPLRHRAPVERVDFSPDGTLLLSQTERTISVYVVATGELKLAPALPEGRVAAAKFIADSSSLFVAIEAGEHSVAVVYKLESGESELRLETGPLVDADINADLTRIVTVSGERCSLWDPDRRAKIREYTSQTGRLVNVKFNRRGDKIAVIGFDNWVRVLSTDSATPLTPELPHDYLVNGFDFINDGDRLATWADDASAILWDSTTGEFYAQPMRHLDRVQFGEMGLIGQREMFLATITHLSVRSMKNVRRSGSAQLWHIHSKREPEDRSRGDHYGHDGTTMSADGTLLALGTITQEAWVMRTDTGETVCGPLPVRGGPWGLAFTPDASRLILTTSTGQLAFYSIPSGKLLFERQYPTSFQPVDIASDGQFFVAGSTDGFLRVWDVQTGQTIWERQHGSEINSVAFSPDGRLVASAGEDHITRVWNTTSGTLVHELIGHNNEVMRVVFNPEGSSLVTASQDFTARVWDTVSGKLLLVLPHRGEVLDAAYSPDGRRIATGSRDRTAMIWDAKTGQPGKRPLHHLQAVRSVRFTADGQRLLTLDYYGPRVWDVASGHPLSVRLPHRIHVGDGFQSISGDPQLTPDGESLFIAMNSRYAKLWRVSVPPPEIPGWFPELLEAIAGLRFLVSVDTPESVSPDQFLALERQLQTSTATDFYTRWARDWLADRDGSSTANDE